MMNVGAQRFTKQILIIGTNGTGKTTFCSNLITRALTKGARALIVTPDDYEWQQYRMIEPDTRSLKKFTGVRRMIFDNRTLESVTDFYTCGILIFDDCRSYFGSNTESDLHKLMIRRRQLGLNIVAVGHGFTEIPPKFFTFASDIVLFRTLDNIRRRRDELRNFDEMLRAQIEVNEQAVINPHFYKIIKVR